MRRDGENRRAKENKEIIDELYFDGCENKHCSHFGCGRQLTLQESLFGNKCINHQASDKVNIMLVLKRKTVMEGLQQDLELFMCRVEEMRQAQKQSAASKQSVTSRNLAESKAKEVDNLLARYKSKGYDPSKYKLNAVVGKMF